MPSRHVDRLWFLFDADLYRFFASTTERIAGRYAGGAHLVTGLLFRRHERPSRRRQTLALSDIDATALASLAAVPAMR